MAHDAFISYSHAADAELAPALQRALKRLAKPWYRLRALDVFRDETDLSASNDLTGAIRGALATARFFVYLASPGAAASRWVGDEIDLWKARNPPETLLIALTEGEIAWDDARGEFDWDRSTALHPKLKGLFPSVPLWVDLRWAKSSVQLSARDPRFQRAVAKLAAPMHGTTLDELIGEEVRQHRITRRVIGATIGALGLLLALSLGATFVAKRVNQDLERKLALINTALPMFGEEGAGGEAGSGSSALARLRSRIDYLLWPAAAEEWVEWGPELIAVADECADPSLAEQPRRLCQDIGEAFDSDGLRKDVRDLSLLAVTAATDLLSGRAGDLVCGERNPQGADERAKRAACEGSLRMGDEWSILIPRALWERLSTSSQPPLATSPLEGIPHSPRFIQLWRRRLVGAELVALQLVDTAYCGSRGCDNPTLFFLVIGDRAKLVLIEDVADEFFVYDAKRGLMPQIFSIDANQSGHADQRRTVRRLAFAHSCLCYGTYLEATVRSEKSFDNDRRIPLSLD